MGTDTVYTMVCCTVAVVLWKQKKNRKVGLRVDRGRIDKLPRSRRLPFLDLCVQNGSPRDACSRWFTCGFVKGPQTPHPTFFSSRCSILLTLVFERTRMIEPIQYCARGRASVFVSMASDVFR